MVSDQSRRRRAAVASLLAATMAMLAASTGCHRPLFTPDDNRTQYDRYLRARNQHAPAVVEDEYGRRRPNLRERLSPRE